MSSFYGDARKNSVLSDDGKEYNLAIFRLMPAKEKRESARMSNKRTSMAKQAQRKVSHVVGRKSSTIFAGLKRLSKRGSMISLVGTLESKTLRSPVDEAFLKDLNLEFLPTRCGEFFKEESYIVMAEHNVVDSFSDELVRQREIHCLGVNEAQLRRVLCLADRFASFFKDHVRTALYKEVMGRESAQFERYFEDHGGFITYFDGPGTEGFNQLGWEEAESYKPRLLKLRPADKYARVSRAWEVPCAPEQLKQGTFVLDAGKKLYTFQKQSNPRTAMQAKLLTKVFDGSREGVDALDIDDRFWKLLGCEDEQDGMTKMEENVPRRSRADTRTGTENRQKYLCVVEDHSAPSDKLEFTELGSKKLNQMMLGKSGSDKVYVVDDCGRELFVYTIKVDLSLEDAAKIGYAYALKQGYPEDTSVSLIPGNANLINEPFQDVFEY